MNNDLQQARFTIRNPEIPTITDKPSQSALKKHEIRAAIEKHHEEKRLKEELAEQWH